MYLCMYVCMYVHVCMYVLIYVCMYVCMYLCMRQVPVLLERRQSITFHIVLRDHIQLIVKQVTIHSLSSKLILRLCITT